MSPWHVGRSWERHDLEDACPCPKAPCGLAVVDPFNPDCPQHDGTKTIRQAHSASGCPAERAR